MCVQMCVLVVVVVVAVCVCSDVCFRVLGLCMLPDVSVCWALNINVDKVKIPCG